jgi:hypothetical protein
MSIVYRRWDTLVAVSRSSSAYRLAIAALIVPNPFMMWPTPR